MSPQPLFSLRRVNPAFHLRFSWTGWPTTGKLPRPMTFDNLEPLWEQDGMRLLEHACSGDDVQLLFSTVPRVSPVKVAGKAKARLQYDLRRSAPDFQGFSRNVSLRSVGDNTRERVERYIAGQVGKERFPQRFEAVVQEFTVRCPEVDLSQPTETSHGRYWYNLHVVLVVAENGEIHDRKCLARIGDGCFRIAAKKDHRIAILSLMPDHLHTGAPWEYPGLAARDRTGVPE